MEAFARPLLHAQLPPPAGLRAWNDSDPSARYAVYRNNVIASLVDALADTYPVVRQLVAEAFFRAMAREFAIDHPPRSPVLAHYGEGFSAFVGGFEPAASLPYLADVARLEWAYVKAFHAADVAGLPTSTLAGLLADPERLAAARFRFAPSVSLIRSAHAVVSIWRAHQEPGEVPRFDVSGAQAALVLRPELEPRVIPLLDPAAEFVQALISGESLGRAFAPFAANDSLDIAALLSLLLQMQALVEVQTIAEKQHD